MVQQIQSVASSCIGLIRSPSYLPSPLKKASVIKRRSFAGPGLISRQRRSFFEYHVPLATSQDTSDDAVEEASDLIGEDAAVFKLEDQKLSSWIIFSLLLATALIALYIVWINPQTGYADEFLSFLSDFNSSPEIVILTLLSLFAVVHSGLAAVRTQGEQLIGPRAFRVIFALLSLPLAAVTVGYFINHRYQGTQLWMVQDVPGIRPLVWIMNFVSFWFLYPSTFNLLEVAAVDEPRLHLWETGVTRITRHPQAFGQFLWCFGHTLWIGNSFVVVTSLGLILHHAFGCWHGDRRLSAKYKDKFEGIKNRTSIVPFQAIVEGRQQLPEDYYKEFLRIPYLVITLFTIGTYLAHPLMFKAVYHLGW